MSPEDAIFDDFVFDITGTRPASEAERTSAP
jgi:hypothetical protein